MIVIPGFKFALRCPKAVLSRICVAYLHLIHERLLETVPVHWAASSEDEFKTRYNNHTISFRNIGYEKKTELSKYVWNLKDKSEDFTIKWSVAAKASPYTCGSKRCDLCLTEKLFIAKADPRTLLSKRSEIVPKCRHRNKFTLKRFR